MAEFALGRGEYVVMKETAVRFFGGSQKRSLEEIALTNEAIHIAEEIAHGIFKRESLVSRFPLDEIQNARYEPSVYVRKLDGEYVLQILFRTDTLSVSFGGSKRLCNRWADAVKNAAAGDAAGVPEAGGVAIPDELANAVDEIKDAFGSFFGKKEKESAHASHAAKAGGASLASGKCTGCHAPLAGRRGQVVVCEYCDTVQTL